MVAPSVDVEFSMAVLCYRGQEDVIPFVERLHRSMSLFRFDWEIILVANFWPGTDDRTPEVARGLAERLSHVRCVAEPKQGGMGWDMRSGLDACRGRFIGIIDGDGQYPTEAIFSCFAKIKSEDLDFVKTCRVARADGIYRRLISFLYNMLFALLFPAWRGFSDVNSKPKIMKSEIYRRMDLRSTDWFIDAEIVLNCLEMGLHLHEVPICFLSLGQRQSFVRPRAVLEFTTNLLKYRFGGRYQAGRRQLPPE